METEQPHDQKQELTVLQQLLEGLKREYLRARKAWLITGLVIGVIVGVILIASRGGEKSPPIALLPPVASAQNPFLGGHIAYPTDCAGEQMPAAQDACWQTRAIKENDVSLCNVVKGGTPFISSDACIMLLAHQRHDRILCARIVQEMMREHCATTVQ